jgi:hypothetical protein
MDLVRTEVLLAVTFEAGGWPVLASTPRSKHQLTHGRGLAAVAADGVGHGIANRASGMPSTGAAHPTDRGQRVTVHDLRGPRKDLPKSVATDLHLE